MYLVVSTYIAYVPSDSGGQEISYQGVEPYRTQSQVTFLLRNTTL